MQKVRQNKKRTIQQVLKVVVHHHDALFLFLFLHPFCLLCCGQQLHTHLFLQACCSISSLLLSHFHCCCLPVYSTSTNPSRAQTKPCTMRNIRTIYTGTVFGIPGQLLNNIESLRRTTIKRKRQAVDRKACTQASHADKAKVRNSKRSANNKQNNRNRNKEITPNYQRRIISLRFAVAPMSLPS